MTAHLIVRAQVTDPGDKEAFDRWYQDEHLPQAVAAFHPIRAWRGWSSVDPLIHFAFYEYAELATIETAIKSEAMKGLVSEFDRMWGTRVPRARGGRLHSDARRLEASNGDTGPLARSARSQLYNFWTRPEVNIRPTELVAETGHLA